MKVLDLLCTNQHRFEGWFASEGDFQSQGDRGLIACPMCGGTGISRLPSAPRLNVSKPRDASAEPAAHQPPSHQHAMLQNQLMQATRRLLASTEDVGDRFSEEARRIHYGEADERAIRGRATAEQAAALTEEGIAVVAFDVPAALKGTTH